MSQFQLKLAEEPPVPWTEKAKAYAPIALGTGLGMGVGYFGGRATAEAAAKAFKKIMGQSPGAGPSVPREVHALVAGLLGGYAGYEMKRHQDKERSAYEDAIKNYRDGRRAVPAGDRSK
jgi:hypothetical protein